MEELGDLSKVVFVELALEKQLVNIVGQGERGCPPTPPYTESIEWFTEAQAFLRSFDSAPRPHPSLIAHERDVSLSWSSCVSPVELAKGRGGGLPIS